MKFTMVVLSFFLLSSVALAENDVDSRFTSQRKLGENLCARGESRYVMSDQIAIQLAESIRANANYNLVNRPFRQLSRLVNNEDALIKHIKNVCRRPVYVLNNQGRCRRGDTNDRGGSSTYYSNGISCFVGRGAQGPNTVELRYSGDVESDPNGMRFRLEKPEGTQGEPSLSYIHEGGHQVTPNTCGSIAENSPQGQLCKRIGRNVGSVRNSATTVNGSSGSVDSN